ncbi:FAD-dependent oxidoreductase [Fusobacterium sp.]|uniref:FAD-dependent oxidoreductase n=1 Tax=Fusobacterium sp. TaxID=68766 RepID=UPI002618CED9|nr:FAD-dependent oxidoreductase [Fusobacterium sp.]
MAKIYDAIIIGGGPAGLTSGIYGGRAKLNILIIEKDEIGGQISLTEEVANYPGIFKISGSQLIKNMREQAKNFGVDFIKEKVIKVDLLNKIKKITTEQGEYEGYNIIIASGLIHKELNFTGEREYRGKGISYCSICDGEFFADKDIFVVGAGYAACEEAIFLTRYGKKVHLIAREPEFTCAKTIGDKVFANNKIEVLFNSEVVEVSGDKLARKIKIKNNISGEIKEYSSINNENIGVFIFVGQKPKTEIYKDQIKLDEDGYILTDELMKTNIEKVFAVGDIRKKSLKQVVTAVADGAIAINQVEEVSDENPRIETSQVEEVKIIEEDKKLNLFSEDMIKNIKENLEKLSEKTEIILVKSSIEEENKNILEFINEFKQITDKVQFNILESDNEVIDKKLLERLPAFFLKKDNNIKIKYSIVPLGQELESFIDAIREIYGEKIEVRENLLNRIKKIDKKINVKIGVSLKCTRCSQTVKVNQIIVNNNENISLEIIDVVTHKNFKTKYDIVGVPAMVIDDKNLYFGQMSLEEMIEIIEKQ